MSCSVLVNAVLPAESRGSIGAVRRGILAALASNLSVFGISMLSSVILNRSLGPSGKGIYALLMSTSQLVALGASLGLPKSITFHLAQPEIDRGKCFSTIVSLTLFTLGLVAAVLL